MAGVTNLIGGHAVILNSDERVLRTLEGFLVSAGFETNTAADAHAALNLIRSQDGTTQNVHPGNRNCGTP
jgi:hypothetical protein